MIKDSIIDKGIVFKTFVHGFFKLLSNLDNHVIMLYSL